MHAAQRQHTHQPHHSASGAAVFLLRLQKVRMPSPSVSAGQRRPADRPHRLLWLPHNAEWPVRSPSASVRVLPVMGPFSAGLQGVVGQKRSFSGVLRQWWPGPVGVWAGLRRRQLGAPQNYGNPGTFRESSIGLFVQHAAAAARGPGGRADGLLHAINDMCGCLGARWLVLKNLRLARESLGHSLAPSTHSILAFPTHHDSPRAI